MNDTRDDLYLKMLETFEAWSKVPRPHDKNWQSKSIICTPLYFKRLGEFRQKEWEAYTQARDVYLIAMETFHGT